MEKRKSVGDYSLERKVFQVTIADLANVSNPQLVNDIIEFEDIAIPFDVFKTCFYDNNYNYFELNNQFRNIEALTLNNKIIKALSFYKNYIGGTKVNLIDILILKYMKNKKTRLDDISRISLLKDFNTYDSLVDFKIYNNHLSLDDIFTLYNLHENKKNKRYFRFKIKTTYYSSILDETISMFFNYIVKIPTKIENPDNNEDNISVVSEEDNEVFDDENDEENKEFQQPLLSTNTRENIVYSNYIKKLNTRITHPNLTTDKIDNNLSYDDDDASTESNLTTSSVGYNETNDTFF